MGTGVQDDGHSEPLWFSVLRDWIVKTAVGFLTGSPFTFSEFFWIGFGADTSCF